MQVCLWDSIRFDFEGPRAGNPYTEVAFEGVFRYQNRAVTLPGFYDGDGRYSLRFMPDEVGAWTLETVSDEPSLNGKQAAFDCVAAREGVHGPVRVRDRFHFAYADGTPYCQIGTTCYVWNHQPEALRKKTLETLRTAPFNKIRMCVFPKRYAFNQNDPEVYPFAGDLAGGIDFTRFEPRYWAILEDCIGALREMGIEADIILFHPYDTGRWGFDRMARETDDLYLRYCVARLAGFSNVWWSFANEYDLMPAKREDDWDHFFKLVQSLDPADHLRSIHNCRGFYDHGKPWVTHCSVQSSDYAAVIKWRAQYGKPVVVDECCYEGDIPNIWGSLTGWEMTARFWQILARGGYCGHGETYYNQREELWWAKGGELIGESPARIAFFRKFLAQLPVPFAYTERLGRDSRPTVGAGDEMFLCYTGTRRNAWRTFTLPEGCRYTVDLVDTWEMTVTRLPGLYEGEVKLTLPGKPAMAIRFTKV